MKTWGIQISDYTFIDLKKFTPGDWAQLREIKSDIMKMENIVDNDMALLCAFIAYLHIRTIVDETKRDLSDELH